MRRIMIAMVAAGALALGPAAFAAANGQGPPDNTDGPGPNGPNNFGLCTAYFAGSENGQQNKRQAPPFEALEAAAEEAADDEDERPIEEKVADWCVDNGAHPVHGQDGPPGNGPPGPDG